MIDGNNNDSNNIGSNLEKIESSNNSIENKDFYGHILYCNEAGKKSLYLYFVPAVIFLIGYIHSGGSFSEDNSGAVWWLYFPLLLGIAPITIFVSIYLGIKGLKGNKKTPSYISLTINALEILFAIIIMR